MCIFHIQVRALCEGSFAEISCDDVENAECAIEDVMGHVMLKLFDGGMVDDVTISAAADSSIISHKEYSIQIRVQCPCQHFSVSPLTRENMRREMQKNTGSLLRELFTSVEVENVTLVPAPWMHEGDPALACVHCNYR